MPDEQMWRTHIEERQADVHTTLLGSGVVQTEIFGRSEESHHGPTSNTLRANFVSDADALARHERIVAEVREQGKHLGR